MSKDKARFVSQLLPKVQYSKLTPSHFRRLARSGNVMMKYRLLLELLILRLQSPKPPLTCLKAGDPIFTPMSYPKTVLVLDDHFVAVQLISPFYHPHKTLKSSRVMTELVILALSVS